MQLTQKYFINITDLLKENAYVVWCYDEFHY